MFHLRPHDVLLSTLLRMRTSPLMQMDMMTRARRKGGVGAGARAPRRRGAEAKAKTERRVRRGARAGKEKEAAAESAIAAAPEAKIELGGTEHAGVRFANVPEVGAPSKKKRAPLGHQLTI